MIKSIIIPLTLITFASADQRRLLQFVPAQPSSTQTTTIPNPNAPVTVPPVVTTSNTNPNPPATIPPIITTSNPNAPVTVPPVISTSNANPNPPATTLNINPPPNFQLAPVPVLGAYGQQCGISASYICTATGPGSLLTDQRRGEIECNNAFSCCLCATITCGYYLGAPCRVISANGADAMYGVKQIALQGEYGGTGAVLDCSARRACAEIYVMGAWVDTIVCGAPEACIGAVMEFEQSNGIVCGEGSCIGASIILHSNRALDGNIVCGHFDACNSANIQVTGGVVVIDCSSIRACYKAKVTITDPMERFLVSCGADNSCEDMEIDIIISEPSGGCTAGFGAPLIEWEGIVCGANNACNGLKLNVINNGCSAILINELSCEAGHACTGSIFDFHRGTSTQDIFIGSCLCGGSCRDATGIDKCFNNVRNVECLDITTCQGMQTIPNIANGFLMTCGVENACRDFILNIDVSGASQNLIRRITGFDCGAVTACKDMTVYINNNQMMTTGEIIPILIDVIVCGAPNACDGATFIIGSYVDIAQVACVSPDACNNCTVKLSPSDIGTPCYMGPTSTTTTQAADPTISTEAVPNIPEIPSFLASLPSPITTKNTVNPVATNPNIPPVASTTTTTTATPVTSGIPVIIPPNIVPPQTTANLPVSSAAITTTTEAPVTSQKGITSTLPDIAASTVQTQNVPQTTTTTTAAPDIVTGPPLDVPSSSNSAAPEAPQVSSFIPPDVPQNGGAPAPPQVSFIDVDPLPPQPIVPVVKIGAESPNNNGNAVVV